MIEQHFVLDCNFICHKSRFTTGDLSYKGVATGTIFGFFNQLLDLAESFSNRNLIFIWDSRKSFRKQVFPEYKGKRNKDLTEEEKKSLRDCYDQMELLYEEIIPSIGFSNNFRQTGLEGDDLMAKLVKSENYFNYFFTLFANDHDLYQLLGSRCNMMTKKGDMFVFYGEKDFVSEWGITPKEWIKVKQIAGCNSDEIPGCGRDKKDPKNIIARIGEKTARDYINGLLKPHTKSYKRIDSAEGKEIIDFNKQLVELPHPRTKELILKEDNLDIDVFEKVCKKYGFKEFLVERWDEWERFFNNDYN